MLGLGLGPGLAGLDLLELHCWLWVLVMSLWWAKDQFEVPDREIWFDGLVNVDVESL